MKHRLPFQLGGKATKVPPPRRETSKERYTRGWRISTANVQIRESMILSKRLLGDAPVNTLEAVMLQSYFHKGFDRKNKG